MLNSKRPVSMIKNMAVSFALDAGREFVESASTLYIKTPSLVVG